jgi:hypothetical protein
MILYKLKILAFAMVLPTLLGCGGPPSDQDTESAPPAAVEQDDEAVFEEDFEAGDATQWAETEASEAASSEDPATDPDKE